MSWKWLDRFRHGDGGKPAGGTNNDAPKPKEFAINRDEQRRGERPAIPWVAAENNAWKVPILDLRPYTLAMIFVTTEEQLARDAMVLWRSDGTRFIGIEPASSRTTPSELRYRIDGILPDGVLFTPGSMEDRWAIYYYHGKIICVSSWYHDVRLVADVEIRDGYAEITALHGTVTEENETPEFTVRAFDFLIRSHVLDAPYPAPIRPEISHDPYATATWCFGLYGNHALFATVQHLPAVPPEQPLRTSSLLHIAIAEADPDRVISYLDQGLPCDLIAADGLATLHWALATEGTEMMELLVNRGVPLDVRSTEGATPIMNATQRDRIDKLLWLLERGADPNAEDDRGFTALHRAAEMGKLRAVEILLDHGARPAPEAGGFTPKALAGLRGHNDIAALLEQWEER